MKLLNAVLLYVLILFMHTYNVNAQSQIHKPTNDTFFTHEGRVLVKEDKIALIGSASSTTFFTKGKKATLHLTTDGQTPYNFVVITLNKKNPIRYQLEAHKDNVIELTLESNKTEITIYKATEASIGDVYFNGVDAKKLLEVKPTKYDYKIEFIGNSITCGMGADETEIKCGTNNWYDQHNAYFAYGPSLSRLLNANYLLSSVSGIGMYRNWNDENVEESIMPQVYDNLYLNYDKKAPYTYSFNPDLISICLGTNDMSEGDGTKERLPFNKEKYVNNYKKFVANLYEHYPNVKIVLLNSPMVDGEKNELFVACIKEVKNHFEKQNKKIYMTLFDNINPQGCDYHPNIEDHQKMAKQLLPQFEAILSDK
ncbi:SGNH/GDSL hydrolase family protein [Neptunitalea lumnitzerae]|uniref:Endoglucanase n=1 Tax=Neptunitalea lumnitzerae TaxID=2965509 RepID=A0ABQ5MJX9_9FLAO|nr:SGNH/GDSL hydrolase family protein [Neptunitalea sp. Y10]GLB49355.1 endoglucanase [Neptunitalea sp. Y10]